MCDFDKKLRSHLKQVSREKKSRLTSMEGLLASLGETNNMATPPSVHSMETTNSDTEDVAEEAVDLILQPNVPADDTVNEELLKDEENNNADLAVPPTTGEVHKQNASTTKFHESELL